MQVGSKKFLELYSSRLTTFVLVVYLYIAYLILSSGWGCGVVEMLAARNMILKETLSLTRDLNVGFVNLADIVASCIFNILSGITDIVDVIAISQST